MKSSNWIILLTVIFLVTTYEHLYFSLQVFNHGLIYLGVPWSTMTNIAMVAGIDLTIFFGVRSIPKKKTEDASIVPMASVIVLMTIISILLNVRYMITVPGVAFGFNFDTIIGMTIGIVIPITIIVFAWDEGQTSRKHQKQKRINEDIKVDDAKMRRVEEALRRKFNKVSEADILKYAENNPNKSQRQIAEALNTSQSKVSRVLNGNGRG